MKTVKEQVSTIKSNLVGGVVGGVAAYLIAKKYGNVENKFTLGALAIAGVVVGSIIQAKMSAKSSLPTAKVVNAK